MGFLDDPFTDHMSSLHAAPTDETSLSWVFYLIGAALLAVAIFVLPRFPATKPFSFISGIVGGGFFLYAAAWKPHYRKTGGFFHKSSGPARPE